MSIRKTATAGIILAVLLVLYIGDGVRRDAADARRLASVRLFPAGAERIDRVSVTRLGSSVELFRKGMEWKITQPIRADADTDAVGVALQALGAQERIAPRNASDEELRRYGLNPPGVRASIHEEGSESPLELDIGEDTPISGEVYAKLSESHAVFTVSSALRDSLSAGLYGFRDKRLLKMNPSAAISFGVTWEGQTIEAVKPDGKWALAKPAAAPADARVIEEILSEIQTTRAADFIDTATLATGAFGLESPGIVAIIAGPGADGEATTGTLLIGLRTPGQPPVYYASRGEGGSVFTVPQSLYDKLRVTSSDLRDKTLFTLEAKQVAQLRLVFNGNETRLRREAGGPWTFDDETGGSVDQEFANAIVARLLRMKVAQYLSFQPTPDQSGLDKPYVRVEIEDAEGKVREGIETGRTSKGDKTVYAQRVSASQEEVFLVEGDQPGQFFRMREAFEGKGLLSFKAEQVASVTISASGRVLTFQKSGDAWVAGIVGGKEFFQIKSSLIERFIQAASGLKWKERLDVSREEDKKLIETQSLASPAGIFTFYDETGGELGKLAQGGASESRVYIRLGENQFYAVDKLIYSPLVAALRELIK